jgi:hypothetical protein
MVIQRQKHDLVLGTHGRGFWILDQIDVLRELNADIDRNRPHVFSARPGLQINRFDRGKRNQGDSYYRAPNPPDGVILDYWVPPHELATESSGEESDDNPETSVQLEVLDSSGRRVRRVPLVGQESAMGLHRWIWDMRHETTYIDAENPDRNVDGPRVLPGRYQVKLLVREDSDSTTVEISTDPAMPLANADREYRHRFLVAAARTLGLARSATGAAESVSEFLSNARESTLLADSAPEDLHKHIAELNDSTSSLARQLAGVERTVSAVYSNVERSTALPTQDQENAARWATRELDELYSSLRRLANEELPALSSALMDVGAPAFPGFAMVLPSVNVPQFPPRP